MSSTQAAPSKVPFIVVGTLLIVLLIVYGVLLYFMDRDKWGFFREYTPNLGPGLAYTVPQENIQPLTPTTRAKKNALIQAALSKIQERAATTS